MLEIKKEKDISNKPEKTIKIELHKKYQISNPINNLEEYAEVIPQKIENKQNLKQTPEKIDLRIENENPEENCDNQNLDFSFGKDLQKETTSTYRNNINKENNNSEKTDTNTNAYTLKNKLNSTLNNDISERKEIFSENLSSYHFTDSLSNLRDNNLEENKKLQIIKEKFVSNFKNKERGASLKKVLTLFEKYQNFGIFNLNKQLNNSFSNFKDNPYRNLITENINSLSIIDSNNNKNRHNNKSSFSKLEIDCVNKKYEKCIKSSKAKKSENNINSNINNNKYLLINNKINNKIILKKIINRKKGQDKKIYNLNDDKKHRFFIRKVIREEKYFVDNNGKQKLVGIKQSTFDSEEKNIKKDLISIKDNKINFNLKYNGKNITLLNKKKFAEFLKDKVINKKNNNTFSIQDKNHNTFNKNKNIQINTEFINNKKRNNDNSNNIKIVINKINKINSNPKINLNFIKKYKNKKVKESFSTNDKFIKNDNVVYKTENNINKTFHLIKVDKLKNEKIIEYKPIITNTNRNFNKIIPKIKDNLKILKCQKVDKLHNRTAEKRLHTSNISIYSSNPKMIIQQRQKNNKRNYSFKEIKNITKVKNSNSFVNLPSKNIENNYKKPERHLTIETCNFTNNNNYKFNKIPNKNSSNKNRRNHTFYESKSFSCRKKSTPKIKKNINDEDKNNKPKKLRIYRNKNSSGTLETTINYENKTINTNTNTNTIYIYPNGFNNYFNIHKKTNEYNNINNLNKQNCHIHTSYNNINSTNSYHNTEQNN